MGSLRDRRTRFSIPSRHRATDWRPKRSAFLVAALGLLALGAPLRADAPLRPEEASAHVGEEATVCGRVVGTHYAERSRGKPTFLNLDRPYPNHVFTVVIWGDDRPRFETPPEELFGERICVHGRIGEYRGRAQIVVRDPGQIQRGPGAR